MTEDQARRLALEIARCPVITAVLEGAASPCNEVVHFQKRVAAQRWVAEPWSGHLQKAPILFLSSNPNSGDPDVSVASGDLTVSSEDDSIVHSFEDAFENGPWIGIHDGTHLRGADGRVGQYIAYWGSCKSRASELLGRPAVPGLDYALTEVVHCGSQHEIGVWPAAAECVPRYLDRVLGLSPASVVAVVGAVARDIVRATVASRAGIETYPGPVEWGGRPRHVLFLPHPNARGAHKGVAANLGPDAESILAAIRKSLSTSA